MRRAIRLARRGRGAVHPNPRVGCVLVDAAGTVVGEGWHGRVGAAHAEDMALQAAGTAARGSSCYVTLEPCAHHGRTPPCVDALIAAGVAQVVAAMEDPDPRVAGAGIARLRQAGIEASCGLLAEEAAQLNPGYLRRNAGGRPWLRCKLAASLDGRTALADGSSRWISSIQSRRSGHRLRAESAAIITGIGTVLADDPCLDIRHARALPVPPLRVVLDGQLRIRPDAQLLGKPGRVLVFCRGGRPPPHAARLPSRLEVIALPVSRQDMPAAVLDYLGRQLQVNEALLEAGPTLAGSFIRAGLVDELVVYMAATLFGDGSRPLCLLPQLQNMAQAPRWRFQSVQRMGPDLKLTMRPAAPVPHGAAGKPATP